MSRPHAATTCMRLRTSVRLHTSILARSFIDISLNLSSPSSSSFTVMDSLAPDSQSLSASSPCQYLQVSRSRDSGGLGSRIYSLGLRV